MVDRQDMLGFDFEEERIKQEITKLSVKRVLLQLPEGLKPEGPRLAKIVEESGALPIISADPCYGACDIAVNEAENLGVDLIVHFGHAKLVMSKIPTVYVEARSTIAVKEAVEKALPLLSKYHKIGLATTVQHLESLKQTRTILVKVGKTVIVGNCGKLNYPGQVIGCNYGNVKSIADEVDAFLIGSKPGQKHFDQALSTKELAIQHGKTAYLLSIKEIVPETLLEFPSIDAYVNTACPRISLEAPQKFSKPVLTINEFIVALGEDSWENMLKKGLFEN